MATQTYERKLMAILSADVVDYSRLMGNNEELTIDTLTGHRKMMSSLIEHHNGRVIDSPGDNLLAAFSSVTQAVECAVEIQREMAERNAELSEDRMMEYRIGVNLGDIIDEGDRIYGDGVNIAARLEALAAPGGICISSFVYNQVKNRLKLEYQYLGEQSVKNIKEPVPVYRVLSLPGAAAHRVIEARKAVEKKRMSSSFQEKPSIAVLPFVNMSNDPEQEYFSDGMSEEIIGALAKLEGLKVISRTSAFYFKGKDIDLRTIGEKLKVENLLEGSVRKAGNKIRITAQLISVADDTHLWSESYNRELTDIFDIQEEISQSIVKNLEVQLLSKEEPSLVKSYTENIEAYNFFLEGRFYHSKGPSSYEKAEEYYQKTIDVEPDYAPAYIALAQIYWVSALLFFTPPDEIFPKYMDLCVKAIDIDNDLAEAHSAFGIGKATYEYDWSGAEKSLKQAIELNPGIPIVHYNYAVYLAARGRMDEVIEEVKQCLELDPFNWEYAQPYAWLLSFAGKFDQAMDQAQKLLKFFPNDPPSVWPLSLAYAVKGMYDEGISVLKPHAKTPFNIAYLGYLYGKANKREEARKILNDFLEQEKQEYFPPFMIAQVYVGLGEIDKAFECLDKAYKARDSGQLFIKVHPSFSDLYPDPRWDEQMKKRGLAN